MARSVSVRSGLRNADGVGRHLRLAAVEEQPGVGLDGREHRLLRGLAVRRREQRAAGGRVLLDRLALGDVVGPDLLDRLDDVVKTVEKIWADNIAKSEAIKKYATTRGALFAPSYGEAA